MNLKSLFLATIFPVLLLSGCFIHGDVVEAPPNTAPSKLCGDCHVYEYKEWKDSRHSKAYTSKSFKQQTDHYEVQKCLTCHVAAPIYKQKELSIRFNNPEEGVNCVSCHLTPEHKMAGPLTVLPAHSVEMNSKFYLESRMCGTCHKEHLTEWKTAKKQLAAKEPTKKLETCQECHMPRAKRKLIPEGIFQYMHWEQPVGKHTFHRTVKAPKDNPWIKIEYQLDNKSIKGKHALTVQVTHRIPHSLPSGIFGFKAIDLLVEFKDQNGLSAEEHVHTFYVEEEKNIAPGKRFKKTFYFSAEKRKNAEYLEFKIKRRRSRMDFGQTIHEQHHRI